MKKVGVLAVLILTFGLVGCFNTGERTYVYVGINYEPIYHMVREMDPIPESFYINETFIVNEIKVLTSEYGVTPYQYEYSEDIKLYEPLLQDIFYGDSNEELDGLNKDEIYENDYYYSIEQGSMPEITIYLEASGNQIVLELSYDQTEDSTIFILKYYESGVLYFAYDFGDEYRVQILEMLEIE